MAKKRSKRSRHLTPDVVFYLIQGEYCAWYRKLFSISLNEDEFAVGVFDRSDLLPSKFALIVSKSVCEYLDRITFLEPPSDQGENKNNEKRGRKKEISEVLTEIERDEHREEE